MQNTVLKLDSRDKVLVALASLRKGNQVALSGETYILVSDVSAKQKFVTERCSRISRVQRKFVTEGAFRKESS